jgi:hypothetical protein
MGAAKIPSQRCVKPVKHGPETRLRASRSFSFGIIGWSKAIANRRELIQGNCPIFAGEILKTTEE